MTDNKGDKGATKSASTKAKVINEMYSTEVPISTDYKTLLAAGPFRNVNADAFDQYLSVVKKHCNSQGLGTVFSGKVPEYLTIKPVMPGSLADYRNNRADYDRAHHQYQQDVQRWHKAYDDYKDKAVKVKSFVIALFPPHIEHLCASRDDILVVSDLVKTLRAGVTGGNQTGAGFAIQAFIEKVMQHSSTPPPIHLVVY